jgi:hypothetical protein
MADPITPAMLAAASANAAAVQVARVERSAAAALEDDAYTIATSATPVSKAADGESMSDVPQARLQLKQASTCPAASASKEVSPVWIYFEKLPLSIEEGKEVQRVRCLCKRTLADGSDKLCESTYTYSSKDGTSGMLR